MERLVDAPIEKIKRLLILMGGQVEKALEKSIQGMLERDPSCFSQVHEIEEKVNQEHLEVDEQCLMLLAKQGPVAKDLRMVISFIKINADLERMGDQCVNMSHTGVDFLGRSPMVIPIEISEMAQLVRQMVKQSLDAFVREDLALAKKVLVTDDEVDERKNLVFEKMLKFIEGRPKEAAAALDLILIARNLERLGDHATNIAEDVIFVSTGKDIRHGRNSDSDSEDRQSSDPSR